MQRGRTWNKKNRNPNLRKKGVSQASECRYDTKPQCDYQFEMGEQASGIELRPNEERERFSGEGFEKKGLSPASAIAPQQSADFLVPKGLLQGS